MRCAFQILIIWCLCFSTLSVAQNNKVAGSKSPQKASPVEAPAKQKYFDQLYALKKEAKIGFEAEIAREKADANGESRVEGNITEYMAKEVATTEANYKRYLGALRSAEALEIPDAGRLT